MKVNVTATYSWTEEVTDDDLMEIIEREEMGEPEKGMESEQLDEAFDIWKNDRETAIHSDTINVPDDADCDVNFEVIGKA